MGTEILEILETSAIAVSGFLIKKYVFLEPDKEAKKQRIFYCMSVLLIGIAFLAFGNKGISVYALWDIVRAAYVILCERAELAQLVL